MLLALLTSACATPSARPPTLLAAEAPEYPQAARADGLEGHVVIEYRVTAEGEVAEPRIVESHPPGIFDEAALAALRGWRFAPPAASGGPSELEKVRSRLTFELGDPERYAEY